MNPMHIQGCQYCTRTILQNPFKRISFCGQMQAVSARTCAKRLQRILWATFWFEVQGKVSKPFLNGLPNGTKYWGSREPEVCRCDFQIVQNSYRYKQYMSRDYKRLLIWVGQGKWPLNEQRSIRQRVSRPGNPSDLLQCSVMTIALQ